MLGGRYALSSSVKIIVQLYMLHMIDVYEYRDQVERYQPLDAWPDPRRDLDFL